MSPRHALALVVSIPVWGSWLACSSSSPSVTGGPDGGGSKDGRADVVDAAMKADATDAADATPPVEGGADTGHPSMEGGMTPAAAAMATAETNPACTAIEPFYWEIGDEHGSLASGSVGKGAAGASVTETTKFSIASASKWIYGMYVVQERGAAASLMASEIPFLNFTSGYTNMGSDTTTSQCPKTDTPDTIDTCLTLVNAKNSEPYSYQDPTTIGKFDYDSGHLENHAGMFGSSPTDLENVGNVVVGSLGGTVAGVLGAGGTLLYTEPLLAGGIYTSASEYAAILRRVLGGQLFMRDALGTHAVCTSTAAPCGAAYSPLPEVAWHYSIAHWVEDDASTHGDGAFSSAGAFGFYPWIDATKTTYGVISREESTTSAIQNGYKSAACGRMLREAWVTGMAQTGTLYPVH